RQRRIKISPERVRAVRRLRGQHRAVRDRDEVYRCWYNWSRGPSVCANTLTVPQDRADLTVLRAIERDVLDPEIVEAALFVSLQQLAHPDTASATRRDALSDELARLEAELARYAEAIAEAGPLDAIVNAIRVREGRRDALRRELKALAAAEARRQGCGRDPDDARRLSRGLDGDDAHERRRSS